MTRTVLQQEWNPGSAVLHGTASLSFPTSARGWHGVVSNGRGQPGTATGTFWALEAACSDASNKQVVFWGKDASSCAGLTVYLAAPPGRSTPAIAVQICTWSSFKKQVMMAATHKLPGVKGLASHKSRDVITCAPLWEGPDRKLMVHMHFFFQKSTGTGRCRLAKSHWHCT